MIVGVVKLGLRQQAELGFIEDQNIDEIEQFRGEFDRRRRIEDRRRAGRAGAFEEGGNSGQGNLELADRDIALRKRGRGDIGGINKRVGAGNDDNRVVGIGCRNEGRSGMGFGGFPHQAQVEPLCGEERLQVTAERILAEPADQRRRRAELCGRDRLVRALAAGKVKHRVTGDGFADAGMPVGGCHHIHVDASGNENAAHVSFPKEPARPGLRTPA